MILSPAYFLLEMMVPYLWNVRTHITNPTYYAAKNNLATLTYLTSYIPYAKDRKLISPIKGNCLGTPAEVAIDNHSHEVLEILLKRKVSWNGCGLLTRTAINNDDLKSLKLLVDYGANIHERFMGSTLLHEAAQECKEPQENAEILKYLITKDLDVNERQYYEQDEKDYKRATPLYFALSNGCLKNAKILLENGADKNMNVHGKILSDYLSDTFKKIEEIE